MKLSFFKSCRTIFSAFTFFFLLSLLVQPAFPQGAYVTTPDGHKISLNKNEQISYSTLTKNGKIIAFQKDNPDEIVRVIITFKEEPLAVYKSKKSLRKTTPQDAYASLTAAHSTFKSKLESIAGRLSAKSNIVSHYKIHREYYNAFNGIALECPWKMADYIRTMPEVKNVTLDRKVKAYLHESVHQIGADYVQDTLGYKGDGVLIGVIDTGIDYLHPALGGGIGNGYRVIGGYDFANDDNDPKDGNGHGTHVAGIIGANSDNLKGVAPQVKFLAVKVLNDDGWGTTADVIAGIDYCLDPDGNPATDDAVDIINLSLGGQPILDSPEEIAVNNATRAGVLSVVSAGNEGEDFGFGSPYQTIGSPGTTESALTVGACDKKDKMASFSSKGPDAIHFAIKPEIVAPGVSILSTFKNNGTYVASGTSMAAPHVAGGAALLKQMHSDWTPERLKAVLINSAVPVVDNVSPYVQGNGRIALKNAVKLGLSAEPATLSFGVVDLSQEVWHDTASFKIKNLRNTVQNVSLTLQHNLPAVVQFNFSQSNFSLQPGEEISVSIVITVPQSVPILDKEPFAYYGNIICSSDSDTIRSPFGFIKANMLIVESDLNMTSLLLWDEHTGDIIDKTQMEGTSKYTTPIKEGSYNLFARVEEIIFGETLIVNVNFIQRKNINTKGLNYVLLDHNEAKFKVFKDLNKMKDYNDNIVAGLDTAAYLLDFSVKINDPVTQKEIIYNQGYFGNLWPDFKVNVGSMDHSVTVIQKLLYPNGEEMLAFSKSSSGVASQEDLNIPSGHANLLALNLNFQHKSLKSLPFVELFEAYRGISETYSGSYKSLGLAGRGFTRLIFGRQPDVNPLHYNAITVGIKETDDYHPYPRVATADLMGTEDGKIVFFNTKQERADSAEVLTVNTYHPNDTVVVEESYDKDFNFPIFQLKHNNNSKLRLWYSTKDPFYDGGGIIRPDGLIKNTDFFSMPSLFSPQAMLKNKRLGGSAGGFPMTSMIPCYYEYPLGKNSGRCMLKADGTKYKLMGQSGVGSVEYAFTVSDTLRDNSFIHSPDLFQILGNNKPTRWLTPDQEGKIRLVIFDPKKNINSVGIYLLNDNGTATQLPVEHPAEKEYLASLPKDIPQGFADIAARVENSEGNAFELNISPAFFYGSSITSAHPQSRLRISSYTLDNVNSMWFVAGDTLKYTFTYENFGDSTAKNITVQLPETNYLRPAGDASIHIDSIRAKRNIKVPVNLIFQGAAGEQYSSYTPVITWNAYNKSLTRKHNVFVDFTSTPTGILESRLNIPKAYHLNNNYPNPFNPVTTISYSLPEEAKVKIEIFNIIGQKVATIVDKTETAGSYKIEWNAQNMSSGIYFCRLKVEGRMIFQKTQKLVLMK